MGKALKDLPRSIDDIAAQGDLGAEPQANLRLASATSAAVTLPCGTDVYPNMVLGEPLHKVAADIMNVQKPLESFGVRLIGPPGTGKSWAARLIAYERWQRMGRPVGATGDPGEDYGCLEMTLGPESDEDTLRYAYAPDSEDASKVRVILSLLAQAMQEGKTIVLDEPNAGRHAAMITVNPVFDGRGSLHLPALGKTITPEPGFGVILSYNPGLVGAADLPDAWYSRFPAVFEVNSNWQALRDMGVEPRLVDAAEELDRERLSPDSGLLWTPQFREVKSFWGMRADLMAAGRDKEAAERLAVAMFVTAQQELEVRGKRDRAEVEAVLRMFDAAGYRRLRIAPGGLIPTYGSGMNVAGPDEPEKLAQAGFPRAVAQ